MSVSAAIPPPAALLKDRFSKLTYSSSTVFLKDSTLFSTCQVFFAKKFKIKKFLKLFWELLPIIAVKEKQNKKNFLKKSIDKSFKGVYNVSHKARTPKDQRIL